MTNTIMTEGGFRRNEYVEHHQALAPSDLTLAGRVIWLRTRRPVATCNLIGELAGFGGRAA